MPRVAPCSQFVQVDWCHKKEISGLSLRVEFGPVVEWDTMFFLNFHPTSYCFMFLAQLIWLEGGDMPSLRGRQHAKHLQTVSVFTNSTDASHSSDLEPEVWSPRSRSWYQDFVHAASQNSSRTSQDPTNDGHFTLSFMIEKSFLPVIYHRCSRILPISILLGLTAVLSPVFPWCSHPNSSAAPASLHCRTTHWDGSRDVVMRGWGFNSPGRGRKVRAVWNCEGVKTYWKLDLNQPKSGGEDQDIPR